MSVKICNKTLYVARAITVHLNSTMCLILLYMLIFLALMLWHYPNVWVPVVVVAESAHTSSAMLAAIQYTIAGTSFYLFCGIEGAIIQKSISWDTFLAATMHIPPQIAYWRECGTSPVLLPNVSSTTWKMKLIRLHKPDYICRYSYAILMHSEEAWQYSW